MNVHHRNSKAEQAGRWIGRVWRHLGRQEARLNCWMVDNGVPLHVARGLLCVVKPALVGVMLYAAFWIVLLMVAVVALLAASQGRFWNDGKGQWRDGLDGYGRYKDGVRTDSNRLFEDD